MTTNLQDGDIPFTFEATATAETPRRMARALLGLTLRRARFRITVLSLWPLTSLPFFMAYAGDGHSSTTRALGSLFWGGLLLLVVVLAVSVLVLLNARQFRRTLIPGTVQRTGFGEDEFVTSNALSSTRYSYRAVQSVEVHRGFVFVRFVGQPVLRVYPQSLFPPAAMARLRRAVNDS